MVNGANLQTLKRMYDELIGNIAALRAHPDLAASYALLDAQKKLADAAMEEVDKIWQENLAMKGNMPTKGNSRSTETSLLLQDERIRAIREQLVCVSTAVDGTPSIAGLAKNFYTLNGNTTLSPMHSLIIGETTVTTVQPAAVVVENTPQVPAPVEDPAPVPAQSQSPAAQPPTYAALVVNGVQNPEKKTPSPSAVSREARPANARPVKVPAALMPLPTPRAGHASQKSPALGKKIKPSANDTSDGWTTVGSAVKTTELRPQNLAPTLPALPPAPVRAAPVVTMSTSHSVQVPAKTGESVQRQADTTKSSKPQPAATEKTKKAQREQAEEKLLADAAKKAKKEKAKLENQQLQEMKQKAAQDAKKTLQKAEQAAQKERKKKTEETLGDFMQTVDSLHAMRIEMIELDQNLADMLTPASQAQTVIDGPGALIAARMELLFSEVEEVLDTQDVQIGTLESLLVSRDSRSEAARQQTREEKNERLKADCVKLLADAQSWTPTKRIEELQTLARNEMKWAKKYAKLLADQKFGEEFDDAMYAWSKATLNFKTIYHRLDTAE